jgi:hypothetical protein
MRRFLTHLRAAGPIAGIEQLMPIMLDRGAGQIFSIRFRF